jgi:phospho-N-acetylmuramoyl-pentapeptide-transferase
MSVAVSIQTADLKQVSMYMVISFAIAILAAPVLTGFLYRNRIGKRLRQHGTDGKATPIFSNLHKDKAGTPTMGGLLFLVVTAVLTFAFNLDRGETWLPLFALIAAGVIGGVDDLLNVQGKGDNGGGIRLRNKLAVYLVVALIGAWWFYFKLGFNEITIPHFGFFTIGWWYVPLFVATLIFTSFSLNQTDGLDGLAGGVSLLAFFAYTVICLAQGKLHLATFCACLLGSVLAFLWFNIYPARFFMGDTGSMALGMVIAVLAFLTNTVVVLPFILLIPFIEGISTIIQIVSKRFFDRKIFLVAPIHHHFEALGWPETRVTMRFWVIASIGSAAGLMLALLQ